MASAAQPAGGTAVATPPLASGRSFADPLAITTGDVMARALLLQENLRLIRQYMGLPEAPKPLIRGRGASLSEVFFSCIGVRVRVRQLAFEHLRVEGTNRRPQLPTGEVRPAVVFRLLDDSLAKVLKVKRAMGITAEPPERAEPDDTTATQLFNSILEVAAEVDNLLDPSTRSSNAYVVATVLVHQAMQIHLTQTKRMMPDEPAFEPNKVPDDVYIELMSCFELVAKIAAQVGLPVVEIERLSSVKRAVHPNDVISLAVLMIAELDRMILLLGQKRRVFPEMAPRRKYPSHVLPRVKLLRSILADIEKAGLSKRKKR